MNPPPPWAACCWYFTGSQCDCTSNKAAPQGSFRKLPEGNTVGIIPEITVLSPELFSCLVLWARISTTSLSYGANNINSGNTENKIYSCLSSFISSIFEIYMDIFTQPRETYTGLKRVRFLTAFLPAAAFAAWSEVPCHHLSLTLTLSHWESLPLLPLCVYFSSRTVPQLPTQCKQQEQRHLWPPLLQSDQCSGGGLWRWVNRERRRNQGQAVAKLLLLGRGKDKIHILGHNNLLWEMHVVAHGKHGYTIQWHKIEAGGEPTSAKYLRATTCRSRRQVLVPMAFEATHW